MDCKICLDTVSTTIDGMCCECYPKCTGKKWHTYYDYEIKTKDNILLWLKDGFVVGAWVNKSKVTVPDSFLGEDRNADVVLTKIREVLKRTNGDFPICSWCGNEEEMVGTHDEGIYCQQCWDKLQSYL